MALLELRSYFASGLWYFYRVLFKIPVLSQRIFLAKRRIDFNLIQSGGFGHHGVFEQFYDFFGVQSFFFEQFIFE